MKSVLIKVLGLLAIMAVLLHASSDRVSAQARPSSKTNVAAVDPLGLAVQEPFNIQYEMKAGPVNSWVFRGHWWGGLTGGTGSGGTGTWGGPGLGGAYRFFVADSRALTGLSVAPAADLFFFNQSLVSGNGGTAIVLWIGGDIAYKWIFDQFSIEPLVGLRIGYTPAANAPSKPTGGIATIGLYAGYAW